jgi:uncharacterized Zn-binding protein involved in type VI secretion
MGNQKCNSRIKLTIKKKNDINMKKIILSMLALAMTAMTFTSCEDVPAPYNTPTDPGNTQVAPTPTGTGTVADPYNVMGARDYVAKGGSADALVYVKGTVVTADIDTKYGNATYYISDNGTTYYPLEVYRGYGLDSRKFTSTTQLAEGDVVVVCGKLVNFNGTYEFTSGSYLVEVNGKKITGNGSGTANDPYDIEKALSLISTGYYSTTDDVYISGKVSKIGSIDTTTKYGNATYYISNDGTTTTQLEVYRGYSLNGDKFTSKDEIKVGDEITIKGKLTSYNGTAEVAQGSSIVNLNGSTGTLLNEPFSTDQGNFTITDVTLPSGISYVWKWASASYGMKASAYAKGTKYATESRLTSPAMDLSNNKKATLTFQQAARYFTTAATELKLQVSTNGTTWTDVAIPTYPDGTSWSFVDTTVDLSAYCGQKTVYIGFLYTSTSSSAATWEIKNVLVK